MTFMCHGICNKFAVMTLHKDWWNLGLKSCRNCRMCFDKFRNCPCCGRQLSGRTVCGMSGRKKQAYPVRYIK